MSIDIDICDGGKCETPLISACSTLAVTGSMLDESEVTWGSKV